ncbi:MAG: hypothetical protein R3Y29_01765 [bacterium]
MIYKNLEVELIRNNLKRKDIANVLNVNYCTLTPKLNDPKRLKLHEAVTIKNELFPEILDINYLFEVKI